VLGVGTRAVSDVSVRTVSAACADEGCGDSWTIVSSTMKKWRMPLSIRAWSQRHTGQPESRDAADKLYAVQQRAVYHTPMYVVTSISYHRPASRAIRQA